MDDFGFANTYGDTAGYEPIGLSSDNLSTKIKKLIDNKMMYIMEDVIGLSGTYFLFSIPFCAN